MEHLYK